MSNSTHATGRPRRRDRRPATTTPVQPTGIRGLAVSEPAPAPRFAESGVGESAFDALSVPAQLVTALARSGITTPFPIQTAALPDAIAGRDILGRGRTGSGKTVAFAVPVIARLAAEDRRAIPGRPRALVLVPTRELAAQVAETIRPLAQAMNVRTATVYGGVAQNRQVAALRQGVDVIVATPGRLEDLISQGHCRLHDVSITVLDEADHMADLGFLPAVTRIMDQTRGDGQRLMFSATLDRGVDALVARYLHTPAVHSVDPVESSQDALDHHLFSVQQAHKTAVVTELASGRGRTLLFTRTKHGAKKLARQLTTAGIPALELHGNLSQSIRQRNLAAFTNGSVRVLVATDIAARGIHVDDINLVVHVDPPAEHKTFLHRSGRTARAGATGAVVTLVTPDQAKDVRMLVRKAGITPVHAAVVPGDPQTTALTGPVAERRAPVSVVPMPEPQGSEARSSGRDRRRDRPVDRDPRAGRPTSSASRTGGTGSAGGSTATRGPAPGGGGAAHRRDAAARPDSSRFSRRVG